MSISFLSLVSERELFGNPSQNVVAFSESPQLMDVHAMLLDATDIIQARFLYAPFLLECADADDCREVAAHDGVFEVALDSGLYCIPFEKRLRLSDADYTMTDFMTYCNLFDALRGESDIDPDDVWEDCYDKRGLITFRLVLPNPTA